MPARELHHDLERRTTMPQLTSSKDPERQSSEIGPTWWTVEHTIIWEVAEPVLRDEFERRKGEAQRAQIKAQGADNSVFQHGTVTPRNVDVDHAHLVPDDDWELGAEWHQLKPAFRFGVGARSQFGDDATWDENVETRLREDWDKSYEPSTWERVKRAVRRGFEFRRH
jgi:hypothetical protein